MEPGGRSPFPITCVVPGPPLTGDARVAGKEGKKEAPSEGARRLSRYGRKEERGGQRRIVPASCPASIVRADLFHDRVREGNGWSQVALATRLSITSSESLVPTLEFRVPSRVLTSRGRDPSTHRLDTSTAWSRCVKTRQDASRRQRREENHENHTGSTQGVRQSLRLPRVPWLVGLVAALCGRRPVRPMASDRYRSPVPRSPGTPVTQHTALSTQHWGAR